jgi:hypothetical protein
LDNDKAVKAIGHVLKSFFLMMYEVDSTLVIGYSKIDLSDSFWCMVVQASQQFNFAYVLPGKGPVQLAIDAALSMGWCNSPSFFCTATESGCILAYHILDSNTPLPPHPLEQWFFPVALPSKISLPLSAELLFLLCVYLNDYISAMVVATETLPQLTWITQTLLHAIHNVFPLPEVMGHEGGKDLVSIKKLERQEGLWHYHKEVLGFKLDGSDHTIGISMTKATAYQEVITMVLSKSKITLQKLQEIQGKLQHVGSIAPSI